MAKFVVLINLFNLIILVYSFYIPSLSPINAKISEYPKETQNAVCKIITNDIQASAIAVTTRQLKGVCSSTELDHKLKQLESKITEQFANLINTLEKNGFEIPQHPIVPEQPIVAVSDKNDSTSQSVAADYSEYNNMNQITVQNYDLPSSINENNNNYDNYNYYLKNLDSNGSRTTRPAAENLMNIDEISLLNNSIVQTDEGDVYYYFWRIEGITALLSKKDIYISSSDFSVLGHKIHLQFYPNYLPEYTGVMLRPESKGFIKRHKITVLNQYFTSEISSKILLGLSNDEKLFKIHRSMLNDVFLSGDVLLIKLTLFLES